MLDDFLNLRLCKYGFHLLVFVYGLHNRIILHLLFLCLLLFLPNICEVIAHQSTELHKKLLEHWVISIFLHRLLWLGAHFLECLHILWVLECSHESWTLSDLGQQVLVQPLVLGLVEG